MSDFNLEKKKNIKKLGDDIECKKISLDFIKKTYKHKYSYHFNSLGRPIIQYPQDMIAMQELIWEIKPDLIIETGIAHGGSLIMSASMLALLDMCEAIELCKSFNPKDSNRKVLGIDIDIRAPNKKEIEKHPMSSRIQMIQGSSILPDIIERVKKIADKHERILVCLDSNHTHDHVLAELQAYAPLTSIGSYCVVFDTNVEDMSKEMFVDRPWGPGNNPKTAVREFLKTHNEFEIDKNIENKLLITVAPDGYLKRVI
jgi:cephalosporin hydroxylase